MCFLILFEITWFIMVKLFGISYNRNLMNRYKLRLSRVSPATIRDTTLAMLCEKIYGLCKNFASPPRRIVNESVAQRPRSRMS